MKTIKTIQETFKLLSTILYEYVWINMCVYDDYKDFLYSKNRYLKK